MNQESEKNVICTIATASHFPPALCLANSFLAKQENGKVYILQVGDEDLSLPQQSEKIEVVKTAQIFPAQEIASMRALYNNFEFCNALKPYLLKHLFENTAHRKICYFDSDIFIYENLQTAIWDELNENSILLTPHLIHPAKQENAFQHDFVILRRGVYNAGFIGLRSGEKASEFLDWWKSRLLRGGFYRPDDGYNCDQGWLDLVPGFDLEVKILREKSLNVAFWNLSERKLTKVEDGYFIEGKPLAFFHFSGYSPDKPDVLTKHDTGIKFSNDPNWLALFDRYAREIEKARKQVTEKHLNRFSNQTTVENDVEKLSQITVSVVIPAFNAEKYIAQAIESVLEQSCHELEIIVIDDGSTDKTAEIVRSYGERVKLLQQANSGVAATRNLGILHAKGEFVVFLDADDYFLLPTKIEEQLALARESDCDVVASGWQIVDENRQLIAVRKPWHNSPVLDTIGWLRWQAVLPSAMLFRRDALKAIGGFDEQMPPLEDVDLILRLSLAGFSSRWLQQITVAYRQHDANATRQVEAQAAATEKLWRKFFARKDLPTEVKRLENHVRYGASVWLAFRFFQAGNLSAMKKNLLVSLLYTNFNGAGVLFDWINGFLGLAGETGKTTDAFDLMATREWQELEQILFGDEVQNTFFYERNPNKALPVQTPKHFSPNKIESTIKIENQPFLSTERVDLQAFQPKINLRQTMRNNLGLHRSGWKFALQSLLPLHAEDGVFFDGASDLTFDANQSCFPKNIEKGWVGVFHHPPQMPEWFAPGRTPQKILVSTNFRRLLEFSHGIFCLSESHASWLREQINVPVVALIHPTETPEIKFSVERFRAQQRPRIVQTGHWLRKLNSIYLLPTKLHRTIVRQNFDYVERFFEQERRLYNLKIESDEVEILPFLSNEDYDNLLAENLVYLDLYDATANNAVIECIVRNTPVLVNPLPAVREYLGEEYPFYFKTRMEAARKAEDLGLIIETHEYLKDLPVKEKLTADYFLQSVAKSDIYRRLPV